MHHACCLDPVHALSARCADNQGDNSAVPISLSVDMGRVLCPSVALAYFHHPLLVSLSFACREVVASGGPTAEDHPHLYRLLEKEGAKPRELSGTDGPR